MLIWGIDNRDWNEDNLEKVFTQLADFWYREFTLECCFRLLRAAILERNQA